jgi:hypothetical protein
MADGRDPQTRDARIDRRDAALVAEYIHELSERHGSPLEGEPGDDGRDREEAG